MTDQRFRLFPIIFFILSLITLSAQSRIPGDSGNWLQVTRGTSLGGLDPVIVVFFQVPASFTGPIYFGIRDPEENNSTPDQDMSGGTHNTAYKLFGGDGCYTADSARILNYGNETLGTGQYAAGTELESMTYRDDGTEMEGTGTSVAADNTWVYFDPVYATQGEKVGNSYFFRIVVDGSPLAPYASTGTFKNAFQLIASYGNGTTPVEISSIYAFSYSWCVDFRRTDANTWHFYPFVPDSLVSTDQLDINYYDVDGIDGYTLYNISGNTVGTYTIPGGFAQTTWSSDTNGGTNYTIGTESNGTWHLSQPSTGGSQDENTAEVWAESVATGNLLRIYSDFYKPEQADHVSAYHDSTESGSFRTVTLQITDSSGNSVPYERDIYINNPSSTVRLYQDDQITALAAVGSGALVTTNSDGFYVFACNDSVDETVTFTFTTDGTNGSDRLPSTGTLGTNDTSTVVFTSGNIPTLVSGGTDLTALSEGSVATGIDLTVTDVDGGFITAGKDIYIRIPGSVDAYFDTSVTTPSITGTAAGKVGATVDYPDSKTVHVDVTTNFASGETVILNDLAFTASTSASSGDFEMSYSGSGGSYNVVDSLSSGYDILITGTAYHVWNGLSTSSFTDGANWTGGLPPNDGTAKVIIDNVSGNPPYAPILSTGYSLKELIINSGASLTIDAGTASLSVSSHYENNGTLILSGGTSNVSFSGSGFTGSLGDVVLNSPGTGTLNYGHFDDLTLTAGTWSSGGSFLEYTIEGDINLTSGTWDADFLYVNLYGSWNNGSGSSTTVSNLIIYFMGTSPAYLYGSTTFEEFSCTQAGKQIFFETGTTQSISTAMTVTGSYSQAISLAGTASAVWYIDIGTASQDFSYLSVDYGDALGNDIISLYSTESNCDTVDAVYVWDTSSASKVTTWEGDDVTNPDDVTVAANWSNGLPVSGNGDTIIFDGAGTAPLLAAPWNMTGNTVIIESTGILNMAGYALTCADFQNDGTLQAQAGATVSSGINSDSGTVEVSGGGVISSLGTNFYNLNFSSGTWTLDAGANVGRNLIITAGSVDTNGQTLSVTGNITLGGDLALDTSLTVNGHFLSTGGTLTQTAGTVTFAGGTQTISGSHTWFNISNTSASGTMRFTDGTTQTVNGAFTVTGAVGNLVTLTGTGTAGWNIALNGAVNVSYGDINYSQAITGPHNAFYSDSTIGGSASNANWNIFPGGTAAYTWQGDDATNPTWWSVAANWDTGSVPAGGAMVVIPAAASNPNPVLKADTPVLSTLTLEAGTTLSTYDGSTGDYDLSVSGAVSNNGTLIFTGNESVTLTSGLDTVNGTVRYITGFTGGTRTIDQYNFHNLEINTTGILDFGTNNLTVDGYLDLTAGTLRGTTASVDVNGGLSSPVNGNLTIAGGTIDISGGAGGDIDIDTGSLDADTGTILLDTNGGSFYDSTDDAAVELTANTITFSNTGSVIGSGTVNSLDTASPGLCTLTLPGGNVAIYIDHTGNVNPVFTGFAGDRLPPLVDYGLSLVATGAMTLPANTIISGSEVMEFGAATLTIPDSCSLTTTSGSISLNGSTQVTVQANASLETASGGITVSGATLTIPAGAGTIRATDNGDITLTQTTGDFTLSRALYCDTNGSGSPTSTVTINAGTVVNPAAIALADTILIEDSTQIYPNLRGTVSLTAYGAITQTATIDTSTLMAKTCAAGGVAINLGMVNSADNLTLQSFALDGITTAAGVLTYVDDGGFRIASLQTTATASLTCSAGTINNGAPDIYQTGSISAGTLNILGNCDASLDLTTNSITNLTVTIDGDFIVNSNILGTAPAYWDVGLAGGTFTLNADNLIDTKAGVASGFYMVSSGNVVMNLSVGASTVAPDLWIFDGDTDYTNTGVAFSLNDIQIGTGSAAGILNFPGNISQTIDGDITVLNGGATELDITGDTLTVAGDILLTNLDTFTVAGSTVIMDSGANQTLTSVAGLPFNNLTVSNGTDTAAVTVTASNNTVVGGALTISAGATFGRILDIDGNDLSVTGVFTNDGTLSLTGAGTVTFTSGMDTTSGEVYIDGGTGTTLGSLTLFYDLTLAKTGNCTFPAGIYQIYHDLDASGLAAAAVLDLVTNNTEIRFLGNGTYTPPGTAANFTFYDLTIGAVTLTAGGDIILARNWTNGGTFAPGAFGVTLATTAGSAIDGNTTFNNLTCTVPGKTITMTAGDIHTINGLLTLAGDNSSIPSSLVTLTSSGNWTFNHMGTESVVYAAIRYGQVTGTDISAGNSVDLGLTCDTTSPGWIFGAKDVTWNGSAADYNWFNGNNWDWGSVPNNTDNVFINDVAYQPVISGASVTSNDLTINALATLEAGNGWNLTVTGTFENNGDLIRSGDSTLTFGTYDTAAGPDSGRTIYRTAGSAIQNYATAADYYDLVIENNRTMTTAIDVGNDLTVTGAAVVLSTGGNDLNIAGALSGTGSLNVNAGAGTIAVTGNTTLAQVTVGAGLTPTIQAGGDFSPSTGFTAGASTVEMVGGTAALMGGYTYNNLTINKTAGIILSSTGDTTVSGSLTMTSGEWQAANGTYPNLTHAVTGGWDSTGITFTSGTSTVIINGGTITHAAGQGFNNLTTDGAAGLGSALQVAGNLLINSGTLTATGSLGITVGGNWTNSGTYDGLNGTVTLNGTGAITGMGTALPATANNFYNLTVSGGTRTASGDVVVRNLTDVTGGTFDLSAGTRALTTDTLTAETAGTLTTGGALTVTNGAFTLNAGGTLNGAGAVTVSAGNLLINNGNFQPAGTITVTAGNLSVAATAAGTMTAGNTLTVTSGTSTFSGGTFNVADGISFTSGGLLTVNGGTLDTRGTVAANSGLTVSSGTYTAGNAPADLITVTGNCSLSGTGTLGGSGNLTVTGNVSLSSANNALTAGNRTIICGGNWSDTNSVYDPAGGTSTVVMNGAGAVTMTTSGTNFDNLTITDADVTLLTAVNCDNDLTIGGSGSLISSGFNLAVAGNIALTSTVAPTIDMTGAGTFSVDGTTDIGANSGITLGNGLGTFGNAPTDTVTNSGTITSVSAGAGNVTFYGNYIGNAGTLTGSGAGNPRWTFRQNASFGAVTMNVDPVWFDSGVATHVLTLGGVNSFDTVVVSTDDTVTLAGAGTFTADLLQTGDTAADNDTAVFDAASTNFDINTLANGGRFRLTGSQTTHTIGAYDTNSGWTEFYGGSEVLSALNNFGDFTSFWNLEISSGSYTLGQNITVAGTGHNYDADANAFNDEGLFLTGTGILNGGAFTINLVECFSVAGGAAFNCDTSNVVFTTTGDSYVNGTVSFYDFTSTAGGKQLFFDLGSTITIVTGGTMALTGDGTTGPGGTLNPAPGYGPASTYLELKPSTNPASPTAPSGEYWNLTIASGATAPMQYVCVWYCNATYNIVAQDDVFLYDCPGWLSLVLLSQSYTVDEDGNGKIDAILVEAPVDLQKTVAAYSGFSVTVNGYAVNTSKGYNGFQGYADSSYTFPKPQVTYNDDQYFYIYLNEKDYLDTGATPVWKINGNTTLKDSVTSSKIVFLDPYAADNSTTLTCSDMAPPVIGYTLAVPGRSDMFIHFSEPVFNGAADPDETNLTFSGGLNLSKNGFTRVTPATAGNGAREALVQFSGALATADIIGQTVNASALVDGAGNGMNALARNTTHAISDLLIGPANNGPVEPLWARDLTTASSSGAGTGVINEFDGSQHLKDEDITLQAHLNSDYASGAWVDNEITLRYVQNPGDAYLNGNGLWLDDFLFGEDEVSGLDTYPVNSAVVQSVNGTIADGPTNHVWNFALSGGNITNGLDLSFLFYLSNVGTVPYAGRYAARIEDDTAADWYRRVYPWSFGIRDIVNQGNGVSILNNVINPLKGEQTTLYYSLDKGGMVSVQIFDLAGGLVEILHRGRQDAGEYSLSWNGTNRSNNAVARGIYFVRIVAPGIDEMRKVLVVK